MADQIIEGKRRKLNADKTVDQKTSKKVKNEVPSSSGPSGESELKNGEEKETSNSKEENVSNEDSTKTESSEENTVEELDSREDILEEEFRKIKDIPRHQEILQTFNCEFRLLTLILVNIVTTLLCPILMNN